MRTIVVFTKRKSTMLVGGGPCVGGVSCCVVSEYFCLTRSCGSYFCRHPVKHVFDLGKDNAKNISNTRPSRVPGTSKLKRERGAGRHSIIGI